MSFMVIMDSAAGRAAYLHHLDDVLVRAEAGELSLDEDARWGAGAATNPHYHHAVNLGIVLARVRERVLQEKDYVLGWEARNLLGSDLPECSPSRFDDNEMGLQVRCRAPLHPHTEWAGWSPGTMPGPVHEYVTSEPCHFARSEVCVD
jgi:hypothetical protein